MDENDYDFNLADMFSDDVIKPPPKAYQQLAGLKLAGAHMQRLTLNGKDVDVPTFPYVKSLEDQVRELRKELRIAQNNIVRLSRYAEKMQDEMRGIHVDINRKQDSFM